MREVCIILEENITLNETYGSTEKQDVLGVADSKERWEEMINDYYDVDVISIADVTDVRDSGIEYIYSFYHDGDYIEITIISYTINRI